MSATYQWGGVARLDLVSAPPGAALVFYGPPALHVHATPLLSQHELIQSAAATPAQHDSAQHESTGRDAAEHDSAQLASAQPFSAQPGTTPHRADSFGARENDHNQHNASQQATFVSSETESISHDLAVAATPESVPSASTATLQGPVATSVGVGDLETARQPFWPSSSSSKVHTQPQADQHVLDSHQHAAAAAAAEAGTDGADEGLFGEASVLARGGLKMTEKASGLVLDLVFLPASIPCYIHRYSTAHVKLSVHIFSEGRKVLVRHSFATTPHLRATLSHAECCPSSGDHLQHHLGT